MRTLKKSLCLVLAVVMMFSLCAFGVSADTDFTDYSEIEYTEAVNLLTTLGVITGYEDGTFNPDGTLTRAEACAIIARLMDMDSVSGNATFTDTVGNWAEDYIAYCASEGIVAGYGNGSFGPNDTLTGYAWMKMLLCAAGYDADYENLTGTSWTIGVAKLAKSQSLTDDISGVSYTEGVSRDVACKLAYNALVKVDMVDWKTNTGSVSVTTTDGSSVVVDNGGEYSSIFYKTNDDGTTEPWKIITYVWEAKTTDTTNDFGAPATKYVIDALDVTVTIDDDPVASTNSYTSDSSFASLLSGYKVALDDSSDPETKNINNSYEYSGNTDISLNYVLNGGSAHTFTVSDGDTICETLKDLSANGKVIDFYANSDDVITDIIVTQYTVSEVTKVSSSNSGTTYTVSVGGSGTVYSDGNSDDTAVVAGTVAKNDIVTYVVANDVLYIYPTTTAEGYCSAYSTGNNASVTVDGTKYTTGRGVNAYKSTTAVAADEFADCVDSDITLYLDYNGYAVYTDESSTSVTDYVFVRATGASTEDDLLTGEQYYGYGYVTTEGKASTLYSYDKVTVDGWYKMTEDSDNDGYYNLSTPTSYSSDSGVLNNARLSSSQATIVSTDYDSNATDTIRANSNTTFILRTAKSTYKVYSGLSNLAGYSNFVINPTAYALTKTTSSYATAIYVDIYSNGGSATSEDDDEIIFLLAQRGYTGSGYDSATSTRYYVYDAIVDGAKTSIQSTKNNLDGTAGLVSGRGMVTYSENSDGYITGVTVKDNDTSSQYDTITLTYDDAATGDENDIDYSGSVLSWNAATTTDSGDTVETLSLSSDAVVYYIYGGNNTVVVGDGYDLVGTLTADATMWITYKSSTNHTVTAVYFYTSSALD